MRVCSKPSGANHEAQNDKAKGNGVIKRGGWVYRSRVNPQEHNGDDGTIERDWESKEREEVRNKGARLWKAKGGDTILSVHDPIINAVHVEEGERKDGDTDSIPAQNVSGAMHPAVDAAKGDGDADKNGGTEDGGPLKQRKRPIMVGGIVNGGKEREVEGY